MTCRFKPTPQPKRETALARLTRQAKAVERLVSNHNREVARERVRVGNALAREGTHLDKAAKAQTALQDLYADLEELELGYD